MENRLAEMHSLFDFVMPGYLGTPKQFKAEFAKPIESEHDTERAEALRRTTAPFLLRRLKTDKTVISDLPSKVVQDDYTGLAVGQVRQRPHPPSFLSPSFPLLLLLLIIIIIIIVIITITIIIIIIIIIVIIVIIIVIIVTIIIMGPASPHGPVWLFAVEEAPLLPSYPPPHLAAADRDDW